MTILEKMSLPEDQIPQRDKVAIDALRKYLRDDPVLNELLDDFESTDSQLYTALLMTLDEINNYMQPKLNYIYLDEVKSLSLLLLGGTLQVLNSVGILSARNTITYRDAGGITVQDYDKYGRYINYFNILTNKYINKLMDYKRTLNFDNGFGGVFSEYSLEW